MSQESWEGTKSKQTGNNSSGRAAERSPLAKWLVPLRFQLLRVQPQGLCILQTVYGRLCAWQKWLSSPSQGDAELTLFPVWCILVVFE